MQQVIPKGVKKMKRLVSNKDSLENMYEIRERSERKLVQAQAGGK